jgi:alkanesulfonate monooxygenase SsuD/methylene tetrahydromethanopterin reductase-like flavin-dependent oxidoreductase (luciferase family)
VELAVHLPLMQFGSSPLTLRRLQDAVDAARDGGFAAVSANDHFLFGTPWLDGPTALASMVERSGSLELATTVALASLRGPVPLAKTLAGLDVLSEGRVIAAVGPGSSQRDYDAVGVAFEDRWPRFEEAVAVLRALLGRGQMPTALRFYSGAESAELAPPPWQEDGVPVWIGSWGSPAGLARVARLADGWLASAYNTTPERFAAARGSLPSGMPNALATMWTWVADDAAEADRVLREVLAPIVRRDPDELRMQVCVGTPEHSAELLAAYAGAGCDRVYLWPLGDERRQLDRVASELLPAVAA